MTNERIEAACHRMFEWQLEDGSVWIPNDEMPRAATEILAAVDAVDPVRETAKTWGFPVD